MALVSFWQILTMVILMAVGVLCYKLHIIDEETSKRLSTLTLLVINPLVIFMSYLRPFETELLSGLLAALALSAVSFAASLAVAHVVYRNKGEKDHAVEKFACVYSNCGFIGIPLVNGVVGPEGVFYLTAYITMFNLLVWTHGIAVMSSTMTAAFMKKALASPALIAVFAGFVFFIFNVPVPEFVQRPMSLLAGMNTPLAMIVAGIALSKSDLLKTLKNASVYKLCFLRLVLAPAFAVAAAVFLDIPTVAAVAVIIGAGCPAAANVILFANRYGKDHAYGAELFAATTVLSMGTIPLLLMFI